MEYKAKDGYVFADKQGNKMGSLLYLGDGDSIDNYKQIDASINITQPSETEPPLSEVDLEQLALDHEYRLSMLEIGM